MYIIFKLNLVSLEVEGLGVERTIKSSKESIISKVYDFIVAEEGTKKADLALKELNNPSEAKGEGLVMKYLDDDKRTIVLSNRVKNTQNGWFSSTEEVHDTHLYRYGYTTVFRQIEDLCSTGAGIDNVEMTLKRAATSPEFSPEFTAKRKDAGQHTAVINEMKNRFLSMFTKINSQETADNIEDTLQKRFETEQALRKQRILDANGQKIADKFKNANSEDDSTSDSDSE